MADILGKAIGAAKSIGGDFINNVVDGVRTVSQPSATVDIADLTEDGAYLQYPLHDVVEQQMYITFQTDRQQAATHQQIVETKSFNQASKMNLSRAGNSAGFGGNEIPNSAGPELKTLSETKRKPSEKGETQVRLYLPQAIQFQDGMKYNEFSLGVIGLSTKNAIEAGQNLNLTDVTVQALEKGITGLIDGITATLDTDLGAVAAQRAARKFGADTLAGAISAGTQTALNPNNRVLFEGVNVRTFAFQFVMIAESAEEAAMVEEIVKHFRTEMYPEDILAYKLQTKQGDIPVPVGYVYPKKWHIKFWDGESGTEMFQRLLPCYLVGMSTTYNSSESTYHTDGQPTSVEITLNFIEERPMSRTDVKNSYQVIKDQKFANKYNVDVGSEQARMLAEQEEGF